MKNIFNTVLFLSILVSGQAFAKKANLESLVCSNGEITQMGDRYFEIQISPTKVEFLPYEGSLALPMTDIIKSGNSWAILDKTVRSVSEGEEFSQTVDALLVFDSTARTLDLSVSYDKMEFQNFKLSCRSN